MSKYDERMLKPRSNLLYLQLIPISLTKTFNNQRSISQIDSLSFRLFKGNQLCDQTKMPIPVVDLDDRYSISRVFLNFNFSLAEDSSKAQFVLKVFKNNPKQSKENKVNHCIGECILKPAHYLDEFKKKQTKYFKQRAQISNQFELVFDLYIEKTRFMLQKYVRSMREANKEKVDVRDLPFYNYDIKDSPQSQKKSSGFQNVFISPFRSLEKNRKLIVRNSKIKKHNTTIIQEDSGVYSKSFNKNEVPETNRVALLKPQTTIESRERQKSKSTSQGFMYNENQDDPLKDLQFQQPSGHDGRSQKAEQLEIKMTKSETESKSAKSTHSKVKATPKKLKKGPLDQKTPPKALETPLTSSQTKAMNKYSLTNKILYIAFIVFAFILMLKVMSPSRKT